MNLKMILIILLLIVIVESTIIAIPYLANLNQYMAYKTTYPKAGYQSASFPFSVFNRPVTNNTEHEFDPAYTGSWQIDIDSTLVPSSTQSLTEAEMAFAPSGPSESQSIPTIIVQERADGLLRVEYFEQSWPNSYGLVLYNSSSPGWTRGTNVTILFRSFGSPSPIDPQIAPRSNGNVTLLVGSSAVLLDYPIAWANLSDLYLYGYPNSSFTSGSIQISIYQISG
ncbi:MAG TPA: hypothetical protein VFV92_02145 [Candidatus Bathyarchaeia archaeon]|nr:hypothetical protein [Candidatus Bathyarchaeia archaeon]